MEPCSLNIRSLVAVIVTLFAPLGRTATAATLGAIAATTQSAPQLRQVDVTLLGPLSSIKGLVWPRNPAAHPALSLSVWIEGPCALTVHLAHGRVIKARARSILIISRGQLRDDDSDVVEEIDIPLDGKEGEGPLAEKARRAEALMAEWGAIPNDHMKAELKEFISYRASRPIVLTVKSDGVTIEPTTRSSIIVAQMPHFLCKRYRRVGKYRPRRDLWIHLLA